MKGLNKSSLAKDSEEFPATPTLCNFINMSEKTRQQYIQKRNNLLKKKNVENIIYDERLRPYQNADVHYLIQLTSGKGVFNQQRIGKTPVTLVAMRTLQQNQNLIVVPKSLIYKWRKEYKKWHGGELRTTKWWHTKKRRTKEYQIQEGSLITNYKKILKDRDEIITYCGPFDAMVVDEAHMLRNYRGMGYQTKTKIVKGVPKEIKKYVSPQVTRAIIQVRKNAKDAYALTGTPAPNKPEDIFGILAFILPDLFKSFYSFVDYYMSTVKRNQWNPTKNIMESIDDITGFYNKEKEKEFIEFLEVFSIQRRRKDVMKWLPKVDYEVVLLEPSPKTLKRSKELKEFYETEHVICPTPLSVFTRLRQLAVSPQLLGFKEIGPKFEYILDYIKTYPNKPIIIASWFKEGLYTLYDFLEKNKIDKIVLITGDTVPKQRNAAEENFQNGTYNIILGQIKVIAEGFTFSRGEEIIIIDPSLTQSDNEQIGDRFLPISKEEALAKEGQILKRLKVSKSIDIYIANRLNKKYNETRIINEYIEHLKNIKGGKYDKTYLD